MRWNLECNCAGKIFNYLKSKFFANAGSVKRTLIFSLAIVRKLLHFLYDLLGLRYLYEKLRPSKNEYGVRPPRTIMIWIITSYLGIYTLAFSLYESSYNSASRQVNTIVSQLNSSARLQALGRLPRVQNMTLIYQPDFISFEEGRFTHTLVSPFRSLMEKKVSQELINEISTIVESEKHNLNFSDLSGINLTGRNMSLTNAKNVNFDNSTLDQANFQESNLAGARFVNASLVEVDFSGADLEGVDFTGSDLSGANFVYAKLNRAKFSKAQFNSDTNFSRSSLKGADFMLTDTTLPSGLHRSLSLCASRIFNDDHLLIIDPKDNCYLPTIYFDLDKSSIEGKQLIEIERLALIMALAPTYTLRLEGHSESYGTREYNMALGERRANTVRDILAAHGVNFGRIESISYGHERPPSDISSDQLEGKVPIYSAEKLRRRVEVKWGDRMTTP